MKIYIAKPEPQWSRIKQRNFRTENDVLTEFKPKKKTSKMMAAILAINVSLLAFVLPLIALHVKMVLDAAGY